MKISRITRGTGIVRQYDRAKLGAAVKGSCATLMYAAGAFSAMNKMPLSTMMGGFMSCMYVKELEIYLNFAQDLKPQVNEIVKRAKSIYKKK